jgi:hypothetical protein
MVILKQETTRWIYSLWYPLFCMLWWLLVYNSVVQVASKMLTASKALLATPTHLSSCSTYSW